MELERSTADVYVRHAFTQMLAVAERLGDEYVNHRPLGPTTNAVAALIIHSCELTEFWLGHVGLGRPTERDRESEFSRTATIAELREMVETRIAIAADDLDRIHNGHATADPTLRQFLTGGDESDGSLVLHVLEELYQHLGQMEIAADALLRE
jgi:uncharacterized damage-inducible protein DinB